MKINLKFALIGLGAAFLFLILCLSPIVSLHLYFQNYNMTTQTAIYEEVQTISNQLSNLIGETTSSGENLVMPTDAQVAEMEENLQPFYSLLEAKTPFLLVLESSSCGYCQLYKEETLNEYQENGDLPVISLEIYETFLVEYQFSKFLEDYSLEFSGTPMTYLFADGQVRATNVGSMSRTELDDFVNKTLPH